MKKHCHFSRLMGLTLLSALVVFSCSTKDETAPDPGVGPSAPTPPTTPTIPAPPSDLVTKDNVTLTFTDHSNNEDGFRVYADAALAMTLAANVNNFKPATCAGAFKVSAFNVAGESSFTNVYQCHPSQ